MLIVMIIQEDKKNSDLVWQALNMRLFLLWKELLLMQWLPLIFPIPLFYLEKFSKAQASGKLTSCSACVLTRS